MATFHCAVKYGNTGAAGLHAAYILREGPYFYGEKREELVYKESGNLPSWAKDNPLLFWNMADKHERANGRAYYEFEIALPSELTYEQNIALVHELIEKHVGPNKAYTFAIHDKDATLEPGHRNVHAHIMFCERSFDGIERSPQKFFSQYIPNYPHRGGAKKDDRFTGKFGKGRETIRSIRFDFADMTNRHLEMNGFADVKVDARSLKEQKQAALNAGDIELYERLSNRVKEEHLGPKLAGMYKRVSGKLSADEKKKYFLEMSDEKSRQVYIAKAAKELEAEIAQLEIEQEKLAGLSNEITEFKSAAINKMEAEDYYADDETAAAIDEIFNAKIDEVKASLASYRNLTKEISAGIYKYHELREEALDIITYGKYKKLQEAYRQQLTAEKIYSDRAEAFANKEVPASWDVPGRLYYFKEAESLKVLERNLKYNAAKLDERNKVLQEYINLPESKSEYDAVYKMLKERNDIRRERKDTVFKLLSAGYSARNELLRERSYSKIVHELYRSAKNYSGNSQEIAAGLSMADNVISQAKLWIDGKYFDTPEKVRNFREQTDIRISLLLEANKEYGKTKMELSKKLLTDEKLEKFAVSYAVNFHDRNLEKQKQEIESASQRLAEDKAKFEKMEKPGLFSFDYREQYNAVKKRIEKDEAELNAKVKKCERMEAMLKKELEHPDAEDRIKKFRQILQDRNAMFKKQIELLDDTISANNALCHDYRILMKDVDLAFAEVRRKNERMVNDAEVGKLRVKYNRKLGSDTVGVNKFNKTVDAQLERLAENNHANRIEIINLKRRLLTDERIEQLALSKAVGYKDVTLNRQKKRLDKLRDEYIVKLNELQTLTGKEAEECRAEADRMAERLTRREYEYYEAEKNLKEYMLSQPVLERIDDIKKEYQAFNESIADKIHIIEKDIMDNNELRSELYTLRKEVLTPERNSGIGLLLPFNQLQKAIALAKEAKVKKGIKARIFRDFDDEEREKKKDKGIEL